MDVDVVEAAALAHDLGHAPFGHIGEQVFDEVARTKLGLTDGFEGNAQTIRIVTKLEKRSTHYDGLNLTAATRAALMKYPWRRGGRDAMSKDERARRIQDDPEFVLKIKKFSLFDAEGDELRDAKRSFLAEERFSRQTPEASVMDIADDITYAVHDLEDFYLAGLLDINQIRANLDYVGKKSDPDGRTPFEKLWRSLEFAYPEYFDADHFKAAMVTISAILSRGFLSDSTQSWNPDGSSTRGAVARDQCSALIQHLVNAVTVNRDPFWGGGPFVALERPQWHEVEVLKQITRGFIVDRADVAMLQRGQQNLLRKLVGLLNDWLREDRSRLPRALRQEVELAEAQIGRGRGSQPKPWRGQPTRSILDYLCGLTDDQCVHLYRVLTGTVSPSVAPAFSP
jgi:dGTPase